MNSQISLIKYRDLVSVITPAFNSGRFVAETINSVLSQTYQNWELIIVDDGSTDETVRIVKSFQEKDNRIQLFENESNKGSAFSRNLALRNAKGKWIAFLDSDDVWHPEKLEKQIKFMTENNCHFSYTNYSEIDEDSDETGVLLTGPKIITRNKMLAYCWPGCLTIMYDAVFVGVIQTIDIRINEEYALWINVSKKTDCYLLDENLAKYRRHSNSLSHQSYFKLIKWHYLMFRKLDNNVVASLFLTAGNLIFGVCKKIVYRRKVSKGEMSERMKGLERKSSWRLYKNAWIFLEESKENLLSKEEAKSILKEKGWMIRNTYDFDTKEETSFWFIIKDKLEDISELPFSSRRNIRISQRKYYFNIIDKDRFVESVYPIYVKQQKSFGNRIGSKDDFRQMIEEYDNESQIDFWVVNDKVNQEVVAFSINRIKENSCEYDFMACDPEALRNRTHPYYGLIYTMNQYYLGEKKLKYVCDGSRSITEHSNIQPFLEHNFKFRKAYCKLSIHYKWWLGVVVKLLFPFRNIIPFRKVKAVLKMEAYSRGLR